MPSLRNSLKKISFFIALLFMSIASAQSFDHAEFYTSVGYIDKGPNRLGDSLMRYATLKWSTYHLNIPLFFDPFEYSDELNITEEDYPTDKFALPRLEKWISYPFYELSKQTFDVVPDRYVFGNFENGYFSHRMIQEVKKNEDFMRILRRAISPRKDIELICPPKDRISVAVHVRQGKIYDGLVYSRQIIEPGFEHLDPNLKEDRPVWSGNDYAHPLKFSPEQYYINQIRKLAELYDYEPMYVYIFTDAPNPIELKERIVKVVNLPNVTFDCRTGPNKHNLNVLVDLFSMSQFDCLIYPGQSAYSIIAHLIGNHKAVIYATDYCWLGRYLKLTNIHVDIKDL